MILSELSERIALLFFPNFCISCYDVIATSETFCDKCCNNLSVVGTDVCKLCGRDKDECSCRSKSTYFKELAAPFYYEDSAKNALLNLKSRYNLVIARELGNYMTQVALERYGDVKFDCICCVPLHKKRQRARGYNQSELLASQIAKNLGVTLKSNLLKKIYDTTSQHKLSWVLRKGNLAGVFDVTDAEYVKDKTILLCDDISTSGQTLEECAKMLYIYGAKEIYCVAAALTKSDKNKGKGES